MTAARNCQTPRAYFPEPRKATTQTPSGRVTRGRWTPARGVLTQLVRDNSELAALVATFVLALVLGYATRGLYWTN